MSNHAGAIRRDFLVSHIGGPLRVLLPTLVVLVTYPAILRQHGVAVLGVWSVLSSLLSYASLLDVGFVPLLTREIAGGAVERDSARIDSWRKAAQAVYAVGGAALIVVAAGVAWALTSLGVTLDGVYSNAGILLAVLLLLLATVFLLLAKLELSTFRALHRTYVEQWSLAAATIGTYAAGWIGIALGRPLEWLSLGACLSYAAIFAISFRLSRKAFPELWSRLSASRSPLEWAHVRELVRHGRDFFRLSLVFVLREPVFRLLLATSLGAAAVGVYDVANRVPMLIRELGVSGSTSLLASLSRAAAAGDRDLTRRLMRSALRFALLIGGSALALFAVSRELVLELWLGAPLPPLLSSAALVMTAWWGITLLNAPFYWLLQAHGAERALARAVGLHILGLVVALPLLRLANAGLVQWLVVWLATGLATQLYLYVAEQRTTGLTRPVLLDPSVVAFVVLTVGTVAAGVWGASALPIDRSGRPLAVAAWLTLYAILLGPAVWGWIAPLLRRTSTAP
jgi:O-antigen/teichoic acid export membrane protein